MKAAFLLALTLTAAASIIVGVAVTPRTEAPASPSILGRTATATDSPSIQPLGDSVGDPTAPG